MRSKTYKRIAHTMRARKRRAKQIGRRTRCDICKRKRRLVLDHDHKFAKKHCSHRADTDYCAKCRRGVLCYACNNGIAAFEKFEKRVLQYLRHWRKARKTT